MNPAFSSNRCDWRGERGCQSGDNRPSNHGCARDQRFDAGMIAPIGISACADQACTCPSDLKNRIVDHVKPMLSHHSEARTRSATRHAVPSCRLRRDKRSAHRSPGKSSRARRRPQTGRNRTIPAHFATTIGHRPRGERRRTLETQRHEFLSEESGRMAWCAWHDPSRCARFDGNWSWRETRRERIPTSRTR